MERERSAFILLLVLSGGLAACSSQPGVPMDSRSMAARDPTSNAKSLIEEQSLPRRLPELPTRTVVHGDTLYSIAWESGQDYLDLAKWNQISPPYKIRPGQVLRVLPPTEKVAAPTRKNATSKPPEKANSISTSATSKPGKAVAKADISKTNKTTSSRQSSGKDYPRISSWAWPADGLVVKRYSDRESGKGIDIGGKRGQPIRATAGGRIVYQGSGLRGYGQLIIVKHSEEFLSAYAHNDRIYVKEGDVVKRGQKIADMGSTGTDRVKLHFEIRRQGVPTDPLKYLPKR